jgi:transcriptional regulator with XRE-family HTH domain
MNLIGARVLKRRKELKLTQDQLCGRLANATNGGWNPDRRDLYHLEHCARGVYDVELVALSKALECSVNWLLFGSEGKID